MLKKNISFFDTEARDENLTFHISSDAILVQDAIGDKVNDRICRVHCSLPSFMVLIRFLEQRG